MICGATLNTILALSFRALYLNTSLLVAGEVTVPGQSKFDYVSSMVSVYSLAVRVIKKIVKRNETKFGEKMLPWTGRNNLFPPDAAVSQSPPLGVSSKVSVMQQFYSSIFEILACFFTAKSIKLSFSLI